MTDWSGAGGRATVPGPGRRRASPWGLAIALLALASTAAAQAPAPTIDELVAKAARLGTLRVIVEVKVDPSAPPGRDAIAHAQERVLQELAGTGHRVVRRFATIPFLGLEVTPDALRRLHGSAHVAGIREDRLKVPQPL